jgi:hypothetical protein
MKTLILLCLALAACGSDITAPDNAIPNDLLPGDGVLRFTLGTNCQASTVLFGVDIFLYGPESLQPGESQDYQIKAGTYVTSGKTFPAASRTFPNENTVVVAKERVTRVLSCS